MTIAVCPGSFDPVTLGHLDVIRKASAIFDEVIAVVVHNPDKAPFFTLAQRMQLLEASVSESGIDGVSVDSLESGLLADYCNARGAGAIVKGVRSNMDIGYELPMAYVNENLSGIQTVFMLPRPEYGHVSSSLVRQVAELGGDPSAYVPRAVLQMLPNRAQ